MRSAVRLGAAVAVAVIVATVGIAFALVSAIAERLTLDDEDDSLY